ncbi:MAG: hypothetical protein IPO27_03095 [Bacteroidetes bacterium]|nr:hypothetical protein [Bacteroidota bacterium]
MNLLSPAANSTGVLFGQPTNTDYASIIFNSGNTGTLQFRNANNLTRMTISSSGKVGIGTTTPTTMLHVTGGSDAKLGSGGYAVFGAIGSTNIVIDDNEIMARSNGAVSNLLNADGGDINMSSAALVVQGTTIALAWHLPTAELQVVGNIAATGNLDVSGFIGFGSVETLSDGGGNTIASILILFLQLII